MACAACERSSSTSTGPTSLAWPFAIEPSGEGEGDKVVLDKRKALRRSSQSLARETGSSEDGD